MQNLWALINSLQILSYMAFLWWNLTPNLYIVFNMLLVSHFDVLPLKDKIAKAISNGMDAGKIAEDDPFTENMGVFEYETGMAIVNLIDTVIMFMFLTGIYIVLRLLSFVSRYFP